MKEHDKIRVKSGRLKDCKGDILEVVHEEDTAAYRVGLTEVSEQAYRIGYRVDDSVDLDRHELELAQ